jgi:hypothetical protein
MKCILTYLYDNPKVCERKEIMHTLITKGYISSESMGKRAFDALLRDKLINRPEYGLYQINENGKKYIKNI